MMRAARKRNRAVFRMRLRQICYGVLRQKIARARAVTQLRYESIITVA